MEEHKEDKKNVYVDGPIEFEENIEAIIDEIEQKIK